jgi:hypothetical protein
VKICAAVTVLGVLLVYIGQIAATDLSNTMMEDPASTRREERGIWAAIAYSDVDGKHGFFWGADKRQEAMDVALEHCANAGGEACKIVEVFRNHRHRDDDDDTGFPYNHCGALAVGEQRAGQMTPWSAKSAPTRREAEAQALQACEAAGDKCSIREWVCT